MENEVAQAGDRLQQVIKQAVAALMAGDEKALWQVLDHDSFLALREWDKLRGREVVSLSRLLDSRLQLMASLREPGPELEGATQTLRGDHELQARPAPEVEDQTAAKPLSGSVADLRQPDAD